MATGAQVRPTVKRALGACASGRPASGLTILIYHRVGGGSAAELDCPRSAFAGQLDVLARHDVVSLEEGVRRLAAGDSRPTVALTFDDGFADVHRTAWPMLRERRMPFTLYLATAYMGGTMSWEGSTSDEDPPALTWDQIGEMAAYDLCTLGNHTHSHVRPERLDAGELDACTEALARRTGVAPRHFAYPWGVEVPAMVPQLRARFATAVTGQVGRNAAGADPLRLCRVPVRRTDPPAFFRAKLTGRLYPERAYGCLVSAAKVAGARG